MQTTEYDFCAWLARTFGRSMWIQYPDGGKGRGKWRWVTDNKPMTAVEIATKYIIPTVEEKLVQNGGVDLEGLGFARHWHNFRNMQGMYRIMGGVAFHLKSA